MEHQNPWLSIWTSPRITISHIVATNPNRSLWILAGIYGFCSLMNIFQSMMLGANLGVFPILILAIVLAPFWGWINFTIWSWFVSWVGKWFKGEGSFTTVRAAYAWSCVPMIINIPLWLFIIVLFGQQLFLNFPNAHLLSTMQMALLFAVLSIKVIVAIWSIVIYINALAEVQKFSIIRAIINIFVAAIILTIIVSILFSLLFYALNSVAMGTVMIWNHF